MVQRAQIQALSTAIGAEVKTLHQFHVHFGGQFLLDPNEVNGWGVIGPHDDTNAQDWGNVGNQLNTGTMSPNAMGGLCFPFDVKLRQIYAIHDNSNVAAEAWGWVLLMQSNFNFGTNAETTTIMLNEVSSGAGPRNYLDSFRQLTDITNTTNNSGSGAFIPTDTFPAGNLIGIGVAAPTAVADPNYYVRVHGGYMLFERV